MPFKKGVPVPGRIPFKKGQSGNPRGGPPKLFTSILKELVSEGYKPVKREQIVEAFELLIGLNEEKIISLIADKETPMLIRISGKRMLAKDGFEIVETMLDRAHGKAKQSLEHSGEVDIKWQEIKTYEAQPEANSGT